MHLIVITGFLGSGKTTLLLEIAKQLSSEGKKVAIIENEVGDLGIDDCLIKENGYNVREIYSGCICCSLRLDLITTLLAIERDHDPEIVILEPSGVAGPKQVLSAFQGYGGEIDRKIVINIVDASRYLQLENLDMPIIQDGLETADIIVLNKKDLISETELCGLRKKLNKPGSNAEMIPVSMQHTSEVDSLIEKICSKIAEKSQEEDPEPPLQSDKNMPEPAVYTLDKKMTYSPDMIDRFKENLIEAGKQLSESGAVIGHIKVMMNARKSGYLMLSLTSQDHPPEIKGKLRRDATEINLRINAIAYNVSKERLKEIFQKFEI